MPEGPPLALEGSTDRAAIDGDVWTLPKTSAEPGTAIATPSPSGTTTSHRESTKGPCAAPTGYEIIETFQNNKIKVRGENRRYWSEMLTNSTNPSSGRIRGHLGTRNMDNCAILSPSFQTYKDYPSHRATSVSLVRPKHMGARSRPHPTQGNNPSLERSNPTSEVPDTPFSQRINTPAR